jgi:hypothetical protein
MPCADEKKDLFNFPKLYSIFLHHLWFWRRRFLKQMLFDTFWHAVCPVWASQTEESLSIVLDEVVGDSRW